MSTRTDKHNYYLDIALSVAARGTCMRRNYGAIIVKNDEIISTGYTGAPRGRKNCIDINCCTREAKKIPAGERYELCRSVHAEANCVISAERNKMLGGTMYLIGIDAKSGEVLECAESCAMCRRLVINAGLDRVISRGRDGEHCETIVRDWVFNDDSFD